MIKNWTTEDALRCAFKDWRERQNVANSADGDQVPLTLTVRMEVPAAYAKFILQEVLREELVSLGGGHEPVV